MALFNDDDDVYQSLCHIPCGFCSSMVPGIALINHQDVCPALQQVPISRTDVENNETNSVTEENDDVDESFADALCDICEKLFPAFTMKDHQIICKILHSAEEDLSAVAEEFEEWNSDILIDETPKESNKAINGMQATGMSPKKNIQNEEKKYSPKGKIETEWTENIFMPLGNGAENPKDFEHVKQNFSEVPKNPHFEYAGQKNDDSDLNICDGDLDESLKDFWKRESEYFKKQRSQNV